MSATADQRAQAVSRPAPAPAPAPVATRVKNRRRPRLLALSIALIAAGALGAYSLVSSLSHTHRVIAVKSTVARGQLIEADMLTVANIGQDPALRPVSVDDADAVLGRYAVTDLPAGSLVTSDSTTQTPVPGPGNSLVGVALTPAQMPSQALQPGDKVRIVSTPAEQAEAPSTEPATISAVVTSVGAVQDTSTTVVNVVLPRQLAATLAARVATERIALVLDPQSGRS